MRCGLKRPNCVFCWATYLIADYLTDSKAMFLLVTLYRQLNFDSFSLLLRWKQWHVFLHPGGDLQDRKLPERC